MNLLGNIVTYVRRLVKTPSNISLSDSLIIDYINRFWINDVDARIQVFDLKKKYQFVTRPGFDQYNMPLYSTQVESPSNEPQSIISYPVYQGFLEPVLVNGIRIGYQTQQDLFYNYYRDSVQFFPNIATGTGSAFTTYNIKVPLLPNATKAAPLVQSEAWPYNSVLLRGHVDMTGIISTGSTQDPPIPDSFSPLFSVPVTSVDSKVFVNYETEAGDLVSYVDSGQFSVDNINRGFLTRKGNPPTGNSTTKTFSTNYVDYTTGTIVFQPSGIQPALGNPINVQVSFATTGMPRSCLYFNNSITLRPVPDNTYTVELDAYLTPAAFLTKADAVSFGYMSEYIARGAARKILSDTGDVEQFNFYEPLFREQEILVWKRSQRQWTSTRTPTIYSQGASTGLGSSYIGGSY